MSSKQSENKRIQGRAKIFAHYHKSYASKLRYTIAQNNLKIMHNLDRPLRVLDAGGGNGINTEFLLKLGHSVTLFDFDPEMIQQAKQKLEKLNLMDRCQCVEGSMEKISEFFPKMNFDLIICHHVIEYVKDVPFILKQLYELAYPAGELSMITLNPVSEVIRAILFNRNPILAKSKLKDFSYDAKWFGKATLYSFEQIKTWAEQIGWKFQDFRAIRVFSDYIQESELTAKDKKELLEFEKKLADLEPYRQIGRYIQFKFAKR